MHKEPKSQIIRNRPNIWESRVENTEKSSQNLLNMAQIGTFWQNLARFGSKWFNFD